MGRLHKCRCETDPAHGCPPAQRTLAEHVGRGAVLLDKPAGITSRKAADRVQRLLGAQRAGHGGTLDPMVTGLLPVLLGKSTRVAGVLLGSDKTYVGAMLLHADVDAAELERALDTFRGVIEQVPPRRSRVRRVARRRAIYAFEVTGRQGRRVNFRVRCEGGTYVRKLVHDLGETLGCGAHMVELRRTRVGPFDLSEAVTLDELAEAVQSEEPGREERIKRLVLTVEALVERLLPEVVIADGAVQSVCSGFPVAVPGICTLEEFQRGVRVGVFTLKGELVGIGTALMGSAEIMKADRGLAVAVSPVLMEAGTYPKWGAAKGGQRGADQP